MRLLLLLPLALVCTGLFTFTACNSGKGKTFCDTTCISDTLRFTAGNPDHSFVMVSMKNCLPDAVTWGHDLMLNNRQLPFTDLAGEEVHINKNFIRSYIKDTSYAWLIFNDCLNGQGYIMRIPYSKEGTIFPRNSALNSFDPKFSVDQDLVAWSDRGNLFVEDMTNGKKAMMTFGKRTELDYNAIHETIDSINVTSTRIWAKVKIDGKWQELSKNITLE